MWKSKKEKEKMEAANYVVKRLMEDDDDEMFSVEQIMERVRRQNNLSPDQIYRRRKENSTIELVFWLVVITYLWWTLPEQMNFKFIPHLNDILLAVSWVILVPPLLFRKLRKHCYIPFWWTVSMVGLAVAVTFGIQWFIDHGVRR